MAINNQAIQTEILDRINKLLNKHFATKIDLISTQFLSDPDRRNRVVRIFISGELSTIPQSFIFKQSLPEKSDNDDKDAYARFVRDWAGLEFASKLKHSCHNVPKFYGGDKQHRFILLEDLGTEHRSLVDSLTGSSEKRAVLALNRFMKALGSFHADSFGHVALYEQILRVIDPNAETLEDDLNFISSDLLPKLASTINKLGLTISNECHEEAKSVIDYIVMPSSFSVLTHGDICPDNVFDHEDTKDLQLIDFEWAFVRNALLDGTYLRMSMPTCWCAKAIPSYLIEPLEQIYREELKRTIPTAADDREYYRAYTYACGFWFLQTISLIDSVWDKDRVGPSGPVPQGSLWKSEENSVRPRILSRLQAFIDTATLHQNLPNMKNMALAMLAKLQERWPDANLLEVYPAFLVENQ